MIAEAVRGLMPRTVINRLEVSLDLTDTADLPVDRSVERVDFRDE